MSQNWIIKRGSVICYYKKVIQMNKKVKNQPLQLHKLSSSLDYSIKNI